MLPEEQLTVRDKEWLKKLAAGLGPKELGASKTAVANRLLRIRSILNAKTTAQAVAEAIRRGVIQ